MTIELDHFFLFTAPELLEMPLLEKAGFRFHAPVNHQGQGTGNRSLIFQENYLEFIFLNAREDAEKNPLRLDRRADWRTTGHSPFGICLRGDLGENRPQFWPYHPPYRPDVAIWIHRRNEEDPTYPLLFAVETSAERTLESMRPKNWSRGAEFRASLNSAPGITGLRVSTTSAYAWPLSQPIPGIEVVRGVAPKAEASLGVSLQINQLFSLATV